MPGKKCNMKNKVLLITLSHLLFVIFLYGNTAMTSPPSIQAISHSPVLPIIKGLSTNPVVRVAISIPENYSELQLSSLSGSIETKSLTDIKQVDVYLTAAQPFSPDNKIASFQPTSLFRVNTNLQLKAGVHFIWFSIVLHNNAAVSGKIQLLCSQITTSADKKITVTTDGTNHMKRIGVAVRKAGDDNIHTYRIPGIISTDKGTLIAVYDNRNTGSRDLPGNIDVGMSRSTDKGKTWEPMKVIMDMGEPHDNNGVGDPAILFDPVTRRLWVAALWSKGKRSIAGSLPGISPDTTGQFVVVSSDDDGLTWSPPQSITPQVKEPRWHLFFNGPGNGIAMQDGKLVFAAQYWDEARMPHATIVFSDDHGKSWKGKIMGPKSNTTESQVVEVYPGTLMLNMRDNRGGYRSIATTTNMGESWTEHPTSFGTLKDPVCMASIIKASVNYKGDFKEVLFFSNPNTSSGRYNITIQSSLDGGISWRQPNQLLIDERMCFGYSCLTRIDENTIGILYEGTQDLYFVQVPVNELLK